MTAPPSVPAPRALAVYTRTRMPPVAAALCLRAFSSARRRVCSYAARPTPVGVAAGARARARGPVEALAPAAAAAYVRLSACRRRNAAASAAASASAPGGGRRRMPPPRQHTHTSAPVWRRSPLAPSLFPCRAPPAPGPPPQWAPPRIRTPPVNNAAAGERAPDRRGWSNAKEASNGTIRF